jgi:hypothetical protein
MNEEDLKECIMCPTCGGRPNLHKLLCMKHNKLDKAIELLENDIKDMENDREEKYEEYEDDEIYHDDELIIEGMNIALLLLKKVKG